MPKALNTTSARGRWQLSRQVSRILRSVVDAVTRDSDDLPSYLTRLALERSHLAKSAFMTWSMAECSGKKCLNQVPGELRSLDASAQTNDIEIVVLNTLF